ncbi:MAG: Transcriptional regulator, TetR family protein [Acidimicrobiales bacterium]|nr:Transcriptional regulator, TetR family protein [Acidimicrobiales bacterium]
MAIVAADGLRALTMQRLADELDCAVGTVYTYFPSKGALVAELQREAIERLTTSYDIIRVVSDDELAHWPDERAVAVARLVLFGRFWIASVDQLPREAALLHSLISEPESLVPPEEHHRVLPAALQLLDRARSCVEAAEAAGAIEVDDSMSVVIRWAAALTGTLQTSNLAPLNPEAFDGPRLAGQVLRDLLLGWGAPSTLVDRGTAHADALARQVPLAPLLPVDGAAKRPIVLPSHTTDP